MRPRQAGFTLFELMVVLLLMGVLLTLATLSVAGRGQPLAQVQAQRLQGFLAAAREEALFSGRPLAIGVHLQGYDLRQRIRLDEAPGVLAWQPVEGLPRLAPQRLAEGELALTLAAVPVRLPPEAEHTQAHIHLHPSGEVTPFTLRIQAPDNSQATLTGSALGQWQLTTP